MTAVIVEYIKWIQGDTSNCLLFTNRHMQHMQRKVDPLWSNKEMSIFNLVRAECFQEMGYQMA